jgi:hypothetical protein
MQDGTLEPVRCGASNRCDYCAMFAALEAALVLKLDAHIRQPTVGITTTTRSADYSMEDFKKAERALWRQLRRELEKTRNRREIPREERIEYCGFIEFTTGDGTRSGGARRPHQHALTKGIDPGDELLVMFPLEDVPSDHPFVQGRQIKPGATTCPLELRVAELWYRFTGDAFIVNCRPLRTPAGAIAYLTLHHHKKSQAPPPGFKGRRLRPSKGYYEQPIAELRQLARKLAAHERVIIAVKRVIARDLYHEEASEAEADEGLTAALVRGLRSLSDEPLELQLDIEGEVDHEAERRELVTRTVGELQRLRTANPPELVRVRELNILDTTTGETYRRAIVVLGSVDAFTKKRLLADREAAA